MKLSISAAIVFGLAFALPARAQQSHENFTIHGGDFRPFTASFSYALPRWLTFPSANLFPDAQPSEISWIWTNDQDKTPEHDELPFPEGLKIAHAFTHPGHYHVAVVLVDKKKRSIIQEGLSFQIGEPISLKDAR